MKLEVSGSQRCELRGHLWWGCRDGLRAAENGAGGGRVEGVMTAFSWFLGGGRYRRQKVKSLLRGLSCYPRWLVFLSAEGFIDRDVIGSMFCSGRRWVGWSEVCSSGLSIHFSSWLRKLDLGIEGGILVTLNLHGGIDVHIVHQAPGIETCVMVVVVSYNVLKRTVLLGSANSSISTC
ncbi:hypothetical protein NPIL_427491 [Nephila pilipes]|uniref:Uncharacterized protein n=1 Tax=Nephila pilipes TaxID=299642 RepID=A0A8X6Q4J8_NEPPI|nr:hypothetical protein NPIL_427491 [Nephila pilipes]